MQRHDVDDREGDDGELGEEERRVRIIARVGDEEKRAGTDGEAKASDRHRQQDARQLGDVGAAPRPDQANGRVPAA